MKTMAILLVSASLLLTMGAINITQDARQGGAISGFVLDADGSAIPDAQVCVNDYDTDDHFGCATTDAVGHYQMADLPSGDYRVSAEAAGFVTEFFDDAYGWHDADPVPVEAPNTTTVDFELQVAGSITGTVTDGTNPIADLHVYATDWTTGLWVAGANTDANGDYALFVPTGTYRVRACAACSDLPYADEFYDDTYFYGEATPVYVTAPGTTSGIDFVLDAPGYITGTVTDGTSGIADLYVFATDYDTNEWMAGADTDPNGDYTLFLPTGMYRVRACPLCSQPPLLYADEFYDDTYYYDEATAVPVAAPDTTSGIDFALDVAATITGTVTDGTSGIEGVHVGVSDFDTNHWLLGVDTDSSGNYRSIQ